MVSRYAKIYLHRLSDWDCVSSTPRCVISVPELTILAMVVTQRNGLQ